MKLIVSLHDVAPPFETEIRHQLGVLHSLGIDRLVLKVVPNWHGSHPLETADSLVELLRGEVVRGAQIVLHGYEHRRRGPLRGDPIQRTRAALFAGDAAEFLTLSREDAAAAIRSGVSVLTRAGLPTPSTFCPPGWLMSADAAMAAADAGMRQTVSMFSLRDLPSGRRRSLAGIGYMGAGPWQERGVGFLNALVSAAWLPRSPIARIFLHPQHLPNRQHDAIVRRVSDLLERGWQPITFEDL